MRTNLAGPEEIAADYRELLRNGYVENLWLQNDFDNWEVWWSALEALAASDGLGVQRWDERLGGGSYWVPCLIIVRPDGIDYRELEGSERRRRMLEDWGDTLVDARARHTA